MLFRIANMFMGTGTDTSAALSDIGGVLKTQVLGAIKVIVPIIFTLVAAVGVIYGIMLGIQYAKAEDTEKRNEAKKRLTNAVIGFGIAIIVAAAMWIIANSNAFANIIS